MTTVTLTVDTICDGLGHWQVTAGDGVSARRFGVVWADLQVPLDGDELERLAILVLRAKYAGTPINALGDLLLNGMVV